ncbi:MAG: two-component system sensor histidine kinase NtrB [bacterium]
MKKRTSRRGLEDSLHALNEAAIIINQHSIIQIFNHAAEILFKRDAKDVIGRPFSILWDQFPYESLDKSSFSLQHIECTILNQPKSLLVFKGKYSLGNHNEQYLILLRDMIEIKWLREHSTHKEYLNAIGHLSAGIAHEIRNPLNTISTIIQQLGKDFEPRNNSEEYHKLVDLMYKEIRRINKTIEDILQFTQPRSMNLTLFQLSDLMTHLVQHYHSVLAKGKRRLIIHKFWDGMVVWDYHQMVRVFMNLIQNALDSIDTKGKIVITISEDTQEELELCVHDTGSGIPKEIQSKIFNLFFTTKPDRTGIGLHIAQLIIYEHGGVIFLIDDDDHGATFIIKIPKKIELHGKDPSL